jgi:hypothetical protein
LTSLPARPADLVIKKTPITRVYYRKKFKSKTKKVERETMPVEPSPEQDGFTFGEFHEEYVPDHTIDNDSKDKAKAKERRGRLQAHCKRLRYLGHSFQK